MGSHSVLCALPSAMSRAQGPPDACLTLQDWAKAGPHEQPHWSPLPNFASVGPALTVSTKPWVGVLLPALAKGRHCVRTCHRGKFSSWPHPFNC